MPNDERMEFLGQIIDIFEDFLDEKGVWFENPEREEEDDNLAIIYGSDYDELSNRLEDMMVAWNVLRDVKEDYV